ncbi:MAG: orotidine 5'-phosphate decarboxylase [bacterium]|nr:orotidine 5'-phosphate decarboxylase [bacterium]MDE0234756.1 orotidine 5'-phosphate decarboxylase [bacterium]
MSSGAERVLVRLDGADAEATIRTAQELNGRVGGWVVGMDLILDCGPILVGALCALGKPILVDLSLLARPSVVARAVARMGKLGARWVSVSGLGGRMALEAAVDAGGHYPDTEVTVSASWTGWLREDELRGLGIRDTPGQQVSRVTRLAVRCAADGIVFPARELGVVVQASGNSERLSIIAEAPDRLSSRGNMAEMAEILAGGAHWVIAHQSAVLGE